LLSILLHGSDITLFSPKGQIAVQQHRLMLFSAAVLIGVAAPTLAILYFFAWKYRETEDDDHSDQTTHHGRAKQTESTDRRGGLFLTFVWGIPFAVFVFLSLVMWSATHRLEPQKAIAATTAPQTIEVVAMRWKWLFIYPEQHIATVNYVQIPINTPVQFQLTADEVPMSSFFIPHLAGQLYAMTGHVNPLNLIADTPGDYTGSSAEINGEGFAGMKFTTRATSKADFDQWVQYVQQSGNELNPATYQELLKPSENNAVAYYGYADDGLFNSVLQKYMGSHTHQHEAKQ
jgi:cytochrome o ubiquinol oxidase subunit 2